LVTAITLASDALQAGRYRRALVVVADRLPPTHGRVLPPGVAVVSDGAASCLLSAGSGRGFRLEGSVAHADMAAWSMDLESEFDKFGGYLINLGKQLTQVKKKLGEASGISAEQYRYLVMNNYSRSTIRLFSTQLGFQLKQVMTANLPTHGHVNAVDLLLNLNTLIEQGNLAEGDKVMALASATATWGALSLSYLGRA
jgi:3-oxoacyl-[acyl-carrier-protein] synthase-3